MTAPQRYSQLTNACLGGSRDFAAVGLEQLIEGILHALFQGDILAAEDSLGLAPVDAVDVVHEVLPRLALEDLGLELGHRVPRGVDGALPVEVDAEQEALPGRLVQHKSNHEGLCY